MKLKIKLRFSGSTSQFKSLFLVIKLRLSYNRSMFVNCRGYRTTKDVIARSQSSLSTSHASTPTTAFPNPQQHSSYVLKCSISYINPQNIEQYKPDAWYELFETELAIHWRYSKLFLLIPFKLCSAIKIYFQSALINKFG